MGARGFGLAGAWIVSKTWPLWLAAAAAPAALASPLPLVTTIVGTVGAILAGAGAVTTLRSRDDARDVRTIGRLPGLLAGAAACAVWVEVSRVRPMAAALRL